MGRKILFCILVVVLTSYASGGAAVLRSDDRASSEDLGLRRVAQFQTPGTFAHVGVNPSSEAGYVYLTDFDSGKILRANWRTGIAGEWVEQDSEACSLVGSHISQVHPMKTALVLLLSYCGRIEVLDSTSLHRLKTVFEKENDVGEEGFDMSPDERALAVTVRKVVTSPAYANYVHAEAPFTIIYDTVDWMPKHKWPFAYSYFTPDGRQLAAFYSVGKGQADEGQCGFNIFDAESGKIVSHVMAQTDRQDVGCPLFPLYFRAANPSHVIVDDPTESAVSEWDIDTGKLIRHLTDETTGPGPAPDTNSFSVSKDGRLVAVVRSRDEGVPDYSVTIWDLSDGTPLYHTLTSAPHDQIKGIRFFSDGKHVAFVYFERVDIYEYEIRR